MLRRPPVRRHREQLQLRARLRPAAGVRSRPRRRAPTGSTTIAIASSIAPTRTARRAPPARRYAGRRTRRARRARSAAATSARDRGSARLRRPVGWRSAGVGWRRRGTGRTHHRAEQPGGERRAAGEAAVARVAALAETDEPVEQRRAHGDLDRVASGTQRRGDLGDERRVEQASRPASRSPRRRRHGRRGRGRAGSAGPGSTDSSSSTVRYRPGADDSRSRASSRQSNSPVAHHLDARRFEVPSFERKRCQPIVRRVRQVAGTF